MFGAISSFVTVFKKQSAAEASEGVYMRERVKREISEAKVLIWLSEVTSSTAVHVMYLLLRITQRHR